MALAFTTRAPLTVTPATQRPAIAPPSSAATVPTQSPALFTGRTAPPSVPTSPPTTPTQPGSDTVFGGQQPPPPSAPASVATGQASLAGPAQVQLGIQVPTGQAPSPFAPTGLGASASGNTPASLSFPPQPGAQGNAAPASMSLQDIFNQKVASRGLASAYRGSSPTGLTPTGQQLAAAAQTGAQASTLTNVAIYVVGGLIILGLVVWVVR